ncbi:MAG TPA: hypothetical protein VM076_23960, partial [Gemmatimonadaceae bacterium]|nr:hypothetical protein [Gemmatimonadaceae bacterium]
MIATVVASVACQGDRPGANAAAATSSAARATQRCNAADVSLLIDSVGVGPVLRRVRVAELRDRCTVSDT